MSRELLLGWHVYYKDFSKLIPYNISHFISAKIAMFKDGRSKTTLGLVLILCTVCQGSLDLLFMQDVFLLTTCHNEILQLVQAWPLQLS